MTSKNKKSSNNKNIVDQWLCSVCGRASKISAKRKNDNIRHHSPRKFICPVCKQFGRVKGKRSLSTSVRRYHPKKSILSRGGRPSLGRNYQLHPSASVSGYSEGDGIPHIEKESRSKQPSSIFDINTADNILTAGDAATEQLPEIESSPEIQDAIAKSEKLLSDIQANSGLLPQEAAPPQNILEPQQHAGLPEFEPSQTQINGLSSATPPGSNNQLAPEISPSIGPVGSPLQNPLDVTGIPNPAGFRINADIEGGIGP